MQKLDNGAAVIHSMWGTNSVPRGTKAQRWFFFYFTLGKLKTCIVLALYYFPKKYQCCNFKTGKRETSTLQSSFAAYSYRLQTIVQSTVEKNETEIA